MQPTASIPFGHMADMELGSDVWSQAVVLGKLGTSILIYMDNTRVSFLDDLTKTCSWNILYFIPYTLMIKFTTCFPMVGGFPGTLASSTTKTGRHDIAEILLKVALKHHSWNCKFNLKVLPSYYYFLFYQHWQLLLKWTHSLLYNSKPNLAEMFSMRSYTRVVTFVQIRQKTWPPCDFENSDWSIFKKLLLKNRWRD